MKAIGYNVAAETSRDDALAEIELPVFVPEGWGHLVEISMRAA